MNTINISRIQNDFTKLKKECRLIKTDYQEYRSQFMCEEDVETADNMLECVIEDILNLYNSLTDTQTLDIKNEIGDFIKYEINKT